MKITTLLKSSTALSIVALLALSACGGGGGDGPDAGGTMPAPEPDPAAVARAIDLVASWATKDEDGDTISGWWRRGTNDSGNQEHLSHSHRDGSSAQAVISYDANGPQLNVGLFQHGEPLQTDPWAQASRFVSTNYIGDDPEGVTTSREVITDHDLGPEWHAEELTKDYENAGTLTVGVATDVKPNFNSYPPI